MLRANTLVGFSGNASSSKYVANAVNFDGATNFLYTSGSLTGISDGSTGMFYCFFKIAGGDSTLRYIFHSTSSSGITITLEATNKILFVLTDYPATKNLQFQSSNTYLAGSGWHSLLASWNTNFGAGSKISQIYIDDVSVLGTVSDTFSAFNVGYNAAGTNTWEYGTTSAGADLYNGCIAEFYFAANQFLDFSVTSNRRKFITAANKPVSLGTTGNLPTGTAPTIYFNTNAASYGTNAGTGGNFLQNGTFSNCASSPST